MRDYRTRGERWDPSSSRWERMLRIALLILLGISPPAASTATDLARAGTSSVDQTVAAIEHCMAAKPAAWPEAWQREYLAAVRGWTAAHKDTPRYAEKLRILRDGFGPYWKGLKNRQERSFFEVCLTEVRWYVEYLMEADLPGETEKQQLRDQYADLFDHAANSLLSQFPFLDPNAIHAAKADHLADCYRNIEAPLLPIFLRPVSDAAIETIQERWHDLRYARVDLWRRFAGGRKEPDVKGDVPLAGTHPDYLLTRRSLDQLQGQMWSLFPSPPGYVRDAVAKEFAARKQRVQATARARSQERRLGVAVWQTEYLSFLLAALLETAEIPRDGAVK